MTFSKKEGPALALGLGLRDPLDCGSVSCRDAKLFLLLLPVLFLRILADTQEGLWGASPWFTAHSVQPPCYWVPMIP